MQSKSQKNKKRLIKIQKESLRFKNKSRVRKKGKCNNNKAIRSKFHR